MRSKTAEQNAGNRVKFISLAAAAMKNRYVGPDGELFDSDGPGRISVSLLLALTEEFAHFREGWFKAKLNDICTYGISSQSQDDIDIIRLCNERLENTCEVEKPRKFDKKKFR